MLELGLVEIASRNWSYSLVENAGYGRSIYLLDAPRDVRRERVRQRNREEGATFSMEIADAFFELASACWEPLGDLELERYEVRWNNRSH